MSINSTGNICLSGDSCSRSRICRGRGGHGDHKGRGYDTITLAAPVMLNGERANMAVVVKKTKGNRYKVHRVLTPSGENFVLPKKADAEPTPGGGSDRFRLSCHAHQLCV